MIDLLNAKFRSSRVDFSEGTGGLAKATIRSDHADAELYLQGAHVTHFQPTGHAPVLWLSEDAIYKQGKAIRGGVPLVFPWFGPHASDTALPQHGFARNTEWTVSKVEETESEVTLVLSLSDSDTTRESWPHFFHLELAVSVGTSLRLALKAMNNGDSEIHVESALHTYFSVSNIREISLDGFDGHEFIDQLDGGSRKQQDGSIRFDGEVDRIYFPSTKETGATGESELVATIRDPEAKRIVRVTSHGSGSTVVWNPWIEKAARMADFPNEGYQQMVCIEAANAARDARSLEPGASTTLTQVVELLADGEG